METFRNCGVYAWFDALTMLVAIFVGCIAIAVGFLSKSKTAAILTSTFAVALSLLIGAMGMFGTFMGHRMTESALSGNSVDPSQAARIRAVGNAEAEGCTLIGVSLTPLPLLISLGALTFGIVKKREA